MSITKDAPRAQEISCPIVSAVNCWLISDLLAEALESFFSRYPEAMAVRPDPYSVTSYKKAKTPTAAERESFAQRNPDAMKIRVYK